MNVSVFWSVRVIKKYGGLLLVTRGVVVGRPDKSGQAPPPWFVSANKNRIALVRVSTHRIKL
jgi:hypothetical protein